MTNILSVACHRIPPNWDLFIGKLFMGAIRSRNRFNDEKRLVGLDNEDEFIVILYALEWVKSFSGIEEGIAQVTKNQNNRFFC